MAGDGLNGRQVTAQLAQDRGRRVAQAVQRAVVRQGGGPDRGAHGVAEVVDLEGAARLGGQNATSSGTRALILGGGPRAFQKYESRKATVSKPMSNLLRLLSKHPEHLKDLDTTST